MIRSPHIHVEMNRLRLQFRTITVYWKVERRISSPGGNCLELARDLYIRIFLCAYVIRAKQPEREIPDNITLATYPGSRVPVGTEGKTLPFLCPCLPEDRDASAGLQSREGSREEAAILGFHASVRTQISADHSKLSSQLPYGETLLKRRDDYLRGVIRTYASQTAVRTPVLSLTSLKRG